MLRDSFKDTSYFNDFISYSEQRIANHKIALQENKVATDRKFDVHQAIYLNEFKILIARYSMGDKIEKLVEPYIDLVKSMVMNWTGAEYQDMLWMMAIGIMLNIENEIFAILARLVERYSVKDYVLQYFINSKLGLPKKTKDYPIKFERRLVKNLIEPVPEIASQNIKKYLKSWYTFNHGCYWYDLHKSNNFLYFGYWSFECGAVAKIRGLDDSVLKDTQYYPYDLVHFSDKKSQE